MVTDLRFTSNKFIWQRLLNPRIAVPEQSMAFIPHPTLFLSHIRVNDIWFLLAVGAVWELFCRLVVLLVRMKPAWLIEKEVALAVLQVETNAKRKLGPSAFVETSKLERQVLVQQRELEKIYADRKR